MSDLVQEEFAFSHPRGVRRSRFLGEWKVVPVRPMTHDRQEPLDSPAAVVRYWNHNVRSAPAFNPEVECVVVISLNCRLRPRGHQVTSVGSVNEAMISPREIFRAAIVASAFAIILVHNHPSGDPSPSNADVRATRRIREASEIIQITLQDHVIIGSGKYHSFRESGLI